MPPQDGKHGRSSDDAIDRIEQSLALLRQQVSSIGVNVAVLSERMDNQYHAMNNKLTTHFISDEKMLTDLMHRDDKQNEIIESLQLSRAKNQGAVAAATVAGAGAGGMMPYIVEHVGRFFK